MDSTCEDCNSTTKVTLAPYGMGFMAEINCPICGVLYDTNIDDKDVESIKQLLLKTGK